MNRIFTLAGVALAAIFVGVAGMGMTATSAKAQAAKVTDVRVVNATAQPVPTTLQGTNVVSIGNSPSVNVANTPNVAVTSLPAVQIGNDETAPVPVHVVSLPSEGSEDRTYIRLAGFVAMFNGQAGKNGQVFYTVPAGKRLVVLSATAQNNGLPAGQKMVRFDLFDVGGRNHPIPIQHQGADAQGTERSVGVFTGMLVFPAGSELNFFALRSGTTGDADSELIVNGYLENQ
jgi:hypothetical protein